MLNNVLGTRIEKHMNDNGNSQRVFNQVEETNIYKVKN